MAQDAAEHRRFVKTAMSAPYLERDEEHALAVAWKEAGDQRALDRLARAHMRLVISLAGKFRHFGLSMNDLIQEGHVGLLEAAARFDPEREIRFSTYAAWWIRAAIQDYILRNWSIVRGGTSSSQKALFFNLRRLRARLAQRTEGEFDDGELHRRIAVAVGVPTRDVVMMAARLAGPDASLNAPVSNGEGGPGRDRMEYLVCDKPLPDETVSETIDAERRVQWLRSALTDLNERELKILNARRLAEKGATLEAVGARLGISKERVRQIEYRALEKLKLSLLKKHPDRAVWM